MVREALQHRGGRAIASLAAGLVAGGGFYSLIRPGEPQASGQVTELPVDTTPETEPPKQMPEAA